MVRTVCADRRLVELDGPEVGALRAEDRLTSVSSAVSTVRDGGGVLLITDIDALLPSPAEPVATLILTELRTAVATRGVAFVATSAVPDNVDPRLRAPELCDRELGPEPARRGHPQAAAGGAVARRPGRRLWSSTKSPNAHRVSSSPTWPPWFARPRCGRRHRASADGEPPALDARRPDRCAQRHPPACRGRPPKRCRSAR